MKTKYEKSAVKVATIRLKAFLAQSCAVLLPEGAVMRPEYRVPTILGDLIITPYLEECWIACRWAVWRDKDHAGKDKVRTHFGLDGRPGCSSNRDTRLNIFSGKWNFQEYVDLDYMLDEFERELGKLRYRMGFATYDVLKGHGYAVEVYAGNDLLEHYDAGDAQGDSQCFGTGDIGADQLKEFAIQTAKELMEEKRVRGPVDLNEDLLAEERERYDEDLAKGVAAEIKKIQANTASAQTQRTATA